MPRAFVTGGTGFLGRNLLEELVTEGWQVTALHRTTSDLSDIQRLPVDLVAGDLTDPASLTRVLPPAVDAVFHVAADTSVWARNDHRQTRINVDGTRHVVEAALARGARRFVHTSTWNVYGLEQGAISESSPQLGASSCRAVTASSGRSTSSRSTAACIGCRKCRSWTWVGRTGTSEV